MADAPPHTPQPMPNADKRIGILHLMSGKTAKGEDFYAYVSVRPSLYQEFRRKLYAQETMNVEEYGKVLHKGFGSEPTEDVKRFMEEQFGIDPDFPQKWADAIQQELQKLQGK